jgi:hypothetical protein
MDFFDNVICIGNVFRFGVHSKNRLTSSCYCIKEFVMSLKEIPIAKQNFLRT